MPSTVLKIWEAPCVGPFVIILAGLLTFSFVVASLETLTGKTIGEWVPAGRKGENKDA